LPEAGVKVEGLLPEMVAEAEAGAAKQRRDVPQKHEGRL